MSNTDAEQLMSGCPAIMTDILMFVSVIFSEWNFSNALQWLLFVCYNVNELLNDWLMC